MLTIENLDKIVGKHDYEYEIIGSYLTENEKLYVFKVHHLADSGPSREIIVYLERKPDMNGWYRLAGPPIKRNNQVSLTIESIKDTDILFNYIKMLC